MKRLLSFVLVLALLLSLCACKTFAQEPETPVSSDGPSRATVSDGDVSARESEEPAGSEGPAGPPAFR